jgi:hypothetical protein
VGSVPTLSGESVHSPNCSLGSVSCPIALSGPSLTFYGCFVFPSSAPEDVCSYYYYSFCISCSEMARALFVHQVCTHKKRNIYISFVRVFGGTVFTPLDSFLFDLSFLARSRFDIILFSSLLLLSLSVTHLIRHPFPLTPPCYLDWEASKSRILLISLSLSSLQPELIIKAPCRR